MKDSAYFDYENYLIESITPENYVITATLGKGRYSDVFVGKNKETSAKVVIKALKPINLKKINREVLVLKNLQNHPNVIELKNVVYDKQRSTV